MNKQYKLAASLICGDFMNLQKDIKLIEKGKIDYIHFDVMDGVFVPRYGLFPEMITQLRTLSKVPIDLHLMVSKPEEFLSTFYKAELNQPDDIIVVHIESTHHLDRVIRNIKKLGIKAGVALNPATPLSVLDYVLDDIDVVMLMAINPGIVGHKLIPSSLQKIADLKEKLSNYQHIEIEIDGGVSFESAPKMINAGATMLVCGTQTIFQHKEPIDQRITMLRKEIDAKIK